MGGIFSGKNQSISKPSLANVSKGKSASRPSTSQRSHTNDPVPSVPTMEDKHKLQLEGDKIIVRHLIRGGGLFDVYAGLYLSREVEIRKFRVRKFRVDRLDPTLPRPNHDNIIRLVGLTSKLIVTETVQGETLHKLLRSSKYLQLSQVLSIALNIASAMHHLHVKKRTIHRDLTSENIVVFGDKVKLLYFGLEEKGFNITPSTSLFEIIKEESLFEVKGDNLSCNENLLKFSIIMKEMSLSLSQVPNKLLDIIESCGSEDLPSFSCAVEKLKGFIQSTTCTPLVMNHDRKPIPLHNKFSILDKDHSEKKRRMGRKTEQVATPVRSGKVYTNQPRIGWAGVPCSDLRFEGGSQS